MIKLILVTILYLCVGTFLFMAWAFAIPGNPDANASGAKDLAIIRYVIMGIALTITGLYGWWMWHQSPKFLFWMIGIAAFLLLQMFIQARL